jgi:hypothetical protein
VPKKSKKDKSLNLIEEVFKTRKMNRKQRVLFKDLWTNFINEIITEEISKGMRSSKAGRKDTEVLKQVKKRIREKTGLKLP